MRDREREKDRERERQTDRERETHREREGANEYTGLPLSSATAPGLKSSRNRSCFVSSYLTLSPVEYSKNARQRGGG